MRDYCSERWEQRRTVCTPQSSFTGRGGDHRRRLFTTQKSLLLPFSTESHRLFSPEMDPTSGRFITLRWGRGHLYWTGYQNSSPGWDILAGGKHFAFLDIIHTHCPDPPPPFPYLSHHTLGMIRACGPSTCLWTCVVKAVPQAVKTTNEQSTDVVQEKPQLPHTGSKENPSRSKMDTRVHANQYMHGESTIWICFY